MNNQVKIAFYTLGCKLNFTETSYLANSFNSDNFTIVPFSSVADIYIVNTCSVTSSANSKSRNAIRRAHHLNPEAIIAVTGCYAQLKPDEIMEIPGVQILAGSNQKLMIQKLIGQLSEKNKTHTYVEPSAGFCSFEPAYSFGDRTRSFVKVQDGCDYKCSYCTIPLARGGSRNQSVSETVNQVINLYKSGMHEIILTGINLGDFGKTTGEKLIDLLDALSKTPMPRIRLGSIEPNLLTEDIITLLSETPSLMPHFHIPLQSGSADMLKIMRRRYNPELFALRIEQIRKFIPEAFIGIDVIVGVNGETIGLFEESYRFVKQLEISQVHVFSFSERENTDILSVKPKVPPKEIEQRSKLFHKLSEQKHTDFSRMYIGTNRNVLWESSRKANRIFGFTDNYLKCETEFNARLINKVLPAKLESISSTGTIISKPLHYES